MKSIRVRYAPSPTGPQHIGGIRTAIFNYLFAKKNQGTFLLRIEDTDKSRYVEGSIEYLLNALKWLNIEPDEGYYYKGLCGPYLQSERKEIYNKYIKQLLDKDYAYYAFDTKEELETMKEKLKSAKIPSPQYNSSIRMSMKNSLSLPKEVVEEKLKLGHPYVVRLKVPRKEIIRFKDSIRNWISINTDDIDDKVLMKSDGMPTYHFANVIDDHLMEISHVIRGEEWLPSTPVHILLYSYFNWELPIFAHLPLILKPNGKGKLSKREADKEGFPVFPLEWKGASGELFKGYREEGYLPEALLNFLVLLGWSPGNNKELFSKDELIKEFSLERINKSGIKFDINKAKWFNKEYLKKLPPASLVDFLKKNIATTNIYSDSELLHICEIMKDRITFQKDLINETEFFFKSPYHFDIPKLKKYLNDENLKILEDIKGELNNLKEYSRKNIKTLLYENITKKYDISIGKFLPLVRVSITGKTFGADLISILLILSKKETISRIQYFSTKINTENGKIL